MSSVSTEAPQPPRLLEGVAKPTAEPKKRKHADTEPEQLKNNSMGGSSYVLNAPSLWTVVQRQEPPNLISAEMQLVFSQITDVPTGDSIPVSAKNMIGTATYPPGGSDTVEAPLTNDVQPSAPSKKEPAITKATKVLFTKEQDVLILNAAATANAAGSRMNWFQISQSLNRSAYFCEQRLQQLMDSNYIDTSTSTADVPVAIINSSFGKKGKMPFTEQEDNLLRDAVSNANKEEGGRVHWEKISRSLGRSVYYCKQRWQVLSVGNDKDNKQDGCTGTSHKKSSMTAASSSLAPSANAASATIKNTNDTTSASTSSSNAPLISAPRASAAKFKVPAKSADSKQNKPPPPREFSKDEIVLILQAGHEAGGVSRRTRWVKLSKQLHCAVRDCEHQWELLQAARRRATKAMVLLGVPTGLETMNNSSASIFNINININSSSSGSSSSGSATTSKVAYGVTSGDNSTRSSEGTSAVADPTVTMYSESSDLADIATADTVVATNSVPAKRKYTKNTKFVPVQDSALRITTTHASKKRIKPTPVATAISIEDSATAHVAAEKPNTILGSEEETNNISDASTAAPSLVPAKIDTTKADPVSTTTAHQLPQTRHPRRFTKEEDEQIRQAVETAQSEGKMLVWAEVGRLLKRRGEVIQQRWLKSLAPGAGTSYGSGQPATGRGGNGVNITKSVAVSGGEEENEDCVEVDKATAESKFTHQRQAPQLFTEKDDLIITQYMETAYIERRRVRWPEVAAELNRTTHACKQRWHARLLMWYGAKKGAEYEAMSPALRAIVTERPGPNAFSSVQDYTILHSYDVYIAMQGSSLDVTSATGSSSRTNNGTNNITGSSSSSSIMPSINNSALQPLWDTLSHQLHKSAVHISDRCTKLLEERDGTDKLTTLWTIYNQMCSAKLRSTGSTDEVSIVVDSLARAVRQKVHDGGVRNSNIDTKREVIVLTATDKQKSSKSTKLPKVTIVSTATTAATAASVATASTSSSTKRANKATIETSAKTSVVAVTKKISLKDTVVSRNIYDSITGDANDSDSSDGGIADNVKNKTMITVDREITNKTTHEDTHDSDNSDSSGEESSTIVAAAGSTTPAPKRRKGGNHSPGRKHGCNKTARVNKTFTTDEDALIVQAALAAKEGKIVNWPALGKILGRMGCICRRRWVRHLSKHDEDAIALLQNMTVPLPAQSVADSDPINQLSRGRAPRRAFTDSDDAHILEAVRAAVNEGKNVVWREVGEKLDRTGQSCHQRWTLTLAPRNPELKEILSSFL